MEENNVVWLVLSCWPVSPLILSKNDGSDAEEGLVVELIPVHCCGLLRQSHLSCHHEEEANYVTKPAEKDGKYKT
jgi:hypothetical protein